jgi:hypothetical protein
MNNATRLRYLITIVLLAAVNLWFMFLISRYHGLVKRLNTTLGTTLDSNQSLQNSMRRMGAEVDELHTNFHAVKKRVNEIGFLGSIFGYSACQQGMDPKEFVVMSSQMFGETNVPYMHMEVDTNKVNAGERKRRL